MQSRSPIRGLFLVNFAITLGFGVADAFFSTFLFSLGARGLLLGLPLVLYSLSKVVLSPLLGAWSDRVGCRRAILLSLGLYLFVSVSYFCSEDFLALALLRLLQGASCAMFRPVLLSLVSHSAQKGERATVMATFDVSFYGALALGPVLGGILKDIWGFHGIFAAVSFLCVLALAVALKSIPASGTTGPDRESGENRNLKGFRNWGRHGTYRGLLAFIFGRACGISLTGAFLPILLTSKLGLTGARSGMVLASGTAVMTLLLRPVGMLSDRTPRRLLVIVGGTVVSLLYFLIPSALGFYQVLLLTLAIGVFSALSQPASSALLVEEGSRYGMGLTVGTFNAVLNLGFVAGPLLGALLQSALGLHAVFHAAGTLGLAAVILFAASLIEPEQVQIFATDRPACETVSPDRPI